MTRYDDQTPDGKGTGTASKKGEAMSKKKVRWFKPLGGLADNVSRWEWTTGKGMEVIYKDGTRRKSSYKLRELLGSNYRAIEIEPEQ